MTSEFWIVRIIVLLVGLALVGLAAYQVYLRRWAVFDEQGEPVVFDTVETPFRFWFLVAFETFIGALMLIGALGI
jgi:hypothetical protein